MEQRPDEEIREQKVVDVDRESAFRAFTERLGEWWPRQFTFSAESYVSAQIELRQGGYWFERGTNGEAVRWGEVRAWEPPDRVVLSWRISPERTQEPPERASEVEVRFTDEGESATRVTLIHRDFQRHGEGADRMRAGMASEQGWSGLLHAYARVAEIDTTPP